ncbi:deoxyguanosinetriphosphate triphosphohydrolase [Nocardioides sp. AE5]|uniref:deoxyguanosinetriphosphate triphosphohydrolase n=1 Tax=Nocardioides sp. AE5 TaxID=2962573 RepID=UPI0028812225|nr:deoxyguanosinetriphosphate triphosphohydrolase [Nocardioides sp. AE5]MDT0203305.1 deoxyguanosinetriphosphate triphosphohydrolase [Nocardioides sp. AE5]
MNAAYTDHDRERIVPEPPKRVDAPIRTAFERDRARVVHAAASRRLAAKTQVVGPQSDDFVRNRLTHSLEVAQIARDLARALGCHPDITETAALAHDLGHPPFGHNGEKVLDDLSQACGGFEGNAQTLRLLARLESKTFDASGQSVGLNLTRATLDACTKYPWQRDAPGTKFGVYDDDLAVFAWLRDGITGRRKCVEAQVMDLADDIAYSVHDVEDGIVADRIDLTRLTSAAERRTVWATVRDWYLPAADDDRLDAALERMQAIEGWPAEHHDHSRRSLAALKNLTSDLIGRFCGSAQAAVAREWSPEQFRRHEADLLVPEATLDEIAVLKGIAAHYVMLSDERREVMAVQRDVLTELVAVLVERPEHLDAPFAADHAAAPDDAARLRVVIDRVASLTDSSALAWHRRLTTAGAGTVR